MTGFSSFQFADDKVRALSEAGRVSRDLTAVIIPTRAASSGIAAVFKPLFPLFPPAALEGMKHSGMSPCRSQAASMKPSLMRA